MMAARGVPRGPSRKTLGIMRDYYRSVFSEYISSVLEHRRVAGICERQMIDRHFMDMADEDSMWSFSEDAGLDALVWMGCHLRFPDGDKRGKPLKLEGWEAFLVMMIFGWLSRDTGKRRFLDAYIEVARKNGKSTLMGAILDYMAFSAKEDNGSPSYIAATSLDQAGECFRRACRSISHQNGVKVQDSKNNKVLSIGTQEVVAISAMPRDGRMSHCLIVDEYHQHPTDDLINSIASGNMSDPESLVVRITTAGTNLQSPCKVVHDLGRKVLEGSVPLPRYFFAVFCPDQGDSEANPDTWQKANPNWGVSVNIENFKARYQYCLTSASAMIDFKTKNLNMWVNSLARWANMSLWRSRCCDPFDMSGVVGRPCFGGLDLASVSDFAALALDWAAGDEHYQSYRFWIPKDRVYELERQLIVPVAQWVADGYIIATPGPVIDYSWIAQEIQDLAAEFNISLIAADKWKLNELAGHMPDWFQDMAIEFSQGMKSMSPSVNQFEYLYKLGRIHSGGNPVMTWMMSCAESYQDASGNIKLVKPDRSKSKARIDGVIAAIMAMDTAMTQTKPAEDIGDLVSGLSFV